MTDQSDSKASKASRKKPAREPATLDLKATVIDDDATRSAPQDETPPQEALSEETLSAAPEGAEEAVAAPEATLDSAQGTDSIATDTVSQEEPASAPPPHEARPEAVPERRGSPVPLIAAGLLGGLVGAGLVYGLQTWQAAQPQEDPRVAQLEQRVNALGQQRAPQGDFQALDNRLKALEAARGNLDQRLQGIQGTAERAASRAEEALNRPLPQPQAPQNNGAITDLSNRLLAVETQARAAAQSTASATAVSQALDRRISEQEQRLVALSKQVAEGSKGAEASSQAGIRVVLAGRLNDALRNGAPYADLLDALRKSGAEADKLAPLEPFARQGAPTAAALAQSFKPLSTAILREDRSSSGNWSDRLLHMMDRVVTVRPVNEPGATGIPALVSRIEQALARGDVTDAAAAWQALPEPSRRLSEDWGRQVKARAEAGQAAQALSAEALATLTRSTQ